MPSAGIRRTKAGVTLGNRSTPVSFRGGDITAAGDDLDTAALILYPVNNVGGADGDTGVVLPAGVAGQIIEVYNAAAATLKLYPPDDSGTINGGSEGAAISMATKTAATLICMDGTNWGAMYTAA
jgi:hypothetical protein